MAYLMGRGRGSSWLCLVGGAAAFLTGACSSGGGTLAPSITADSGPEPSASPDPEGATGGGRRVQAVIPQDGGPAPSGTTIVPGPPGMMPPPPDAALSIDAPVFPPIVIGPAPIDTAPMMMPPPPGLDQACGELALKYCDRISSCLPHVFKLLFPPNVICANRMRLQCMADATAPDARIMPGQTFACARNTIPNVLCVDLGRSWDFCLGAGTRAFQKTCGSSAQCATGYCRFPATGCGQCSTRAAAGNRCIRAEDCDKGLACHNNVCAAPAGPNEKCLDRPCGPNLACVEGQCRQARRLGEDCRLNEECDGNMGLYCRRPNATADRGICHQVSYAKPADACGVMPETVAVCSGGDCVKNATGAEACLGFAGDGLACGDRAGGRKCQLPASCQGGICSLPTPAACGN